MLIDQNPKFFKIIPKKDKIQVFNDELSTVVGFGARIGGTGGRLADTVKSAINSDGNLVKDVINDRLDTSAKNILDEFTFGVSGALQIGTYINGVSGDIRISPRGIVARDETGANTLTIDGTTGNVTMVGTIIASSGNIGGWDISASALYKDGATDNISAGMAPADYPFYAGALYANRATAPFRVNQAGDVVADSITITGGTITIPTTGWIKGGQTGYNTGTGFFLGYDTDAYKFSIGDPSGNHLTWDGSELKVVGVVSIKQGSEIAIQGWSHDLSFSAPDSDTVAWSAGTITLMDGTQYSISAGDTGNMTSVTFIYLDIAVSTTTLQTTTNASVAAGSGKLLVCRAQNKSSGPAGFEVYHGGGAAQTITRTLFADDDDGTDIGTSADRFRDLYLSRNITDNTNTVSVANLKTAYDYSQVGHLPLAGGTMAGDIAMGNFSLTGVNTITFTDVSGTIAGIQNQNLVDKSVAETIAGTWTFSSFPITPSSAPTTDYQVANKKYVDDSKVKLGIDTTEVTVTDTSTETTLYSFTVPGGILGTNNEVRIKIPVSYLYLKYDSLTLTLRMKYGTSSISLTIDTDDGWAAAAKGYIEVHLLGNGATNSQKGVISILAFKDMTTVGSTSNSESVRYFNFDTLTEDSTEDLTLAITAQFGTGSTDLTITTQAAVAEIIR